MKIHSAEIVMSAVSKEQYPTDNLPEFMLLGRSNVGKSSFINTLLNRKNLAYTSSNPGKTQTLNFFHINESFYFVDVPGYGYAKVSKTMRKKFGEMIEEYLTSRPNLKCVFLLIDFRHKPTEDDILMYDYLMYYDISVYVIATKRDKVNNSQVEKHKKILRETLAGLEDNMILFSSVTGLGKQETLNIIKSYL